MSIADEPSDAQERHGEFQLVLIEKRRKYAEIIAAQKNVEHEIAKKIACSEDLDRLQKDLNQLKSLGGDLGEALETAEIEAERLYYDWVLAIWRNRRLDDKRVLEQINDIESEISSCAKNAEDANSRGLQERKDRYICRMRNLNYYLEQLAELVRGKE
jgi:hypothetical protein